MTCFNSGNRPYSYLSYRLLRSELRHPGIIAILKGRLSCNTMTTFCFIGRYRLTRTSGRIAFPNGDAFAGALNGTLTAGTLVGQRLSVAATPTPTRLTMASTQRRRRQRRPSLSTALSTLPCWHATPCWSPVRDTLTMTANRLKDSVTYRHFMPKSSMISVTVARLQSEALCHEQS